MTQTIVKKPSDKKSLFIFSNSFDVKKKTAKRCVVAAESKRRSMKFGNILWTNKTKLKLNSKINDLIKFNIYSWITRHPQVLQSAISNNCLKVMIDYQTEPQVVPKLLLNMSVL